MFRKRLYCNNIKNMPCERDQKVLSAIFTGKITPHFELPDRLAGS